MKALVGAFSVITNFWMDLRFKLLSQCRGGAGGGAALHSCTQIMSILSGDVTGSWAALRMRAGGRKEESAAAAS